MKAEEKAFMRKLEKAFMRKLEKRELLGVQAGQKIPFLWPVMSEEAWDNFSLQIKQNRKDIGV